jgi:hypothetical protein
MAVYIQIRKLFETELEAVYEFLPNVDETRIGKLVIEKQNGEGKELEPCPGDERKFSYARAARKVFLHYQKGEYPDLTCWAS